MKMKAATVKADPAYVASRKSEYPPQEITRMVEAAYMCGFIPDFDEGSCRAVRTLIADSVKLGKVRVLPDGTYQINKDFQR
jgi:hypothetical protein